MYSNPLWLRSHRHHTAESPAQQRGYRIRGGGGGFLRRLSGDSLQVFRPHIIISIAIAVARNGTSGEPPPSLFAAILAPGPNSAPTAPVQKAKLPGLFDIDADDGRRPAYASRSRLRLREVNSDQRHVSLCGAMLEALFGRRCGRHRRRRRTTINERTALSGGVRSARRAAPVGCQCAAGRPQSHPPRCLTMPIPQQCR